MYKNLKSCVKTTQGITELFQCSTGTRQGCMLSPSLFKFKLSRSIYYIDEVVPNLMVLLYADDLVQCADLPGRLQSQLNVLADFCEKWGMKVNFDKTNVMVFRNGGIIKRNELWYFKGQQLRPATYYKYLGLVISSRLTWTKALQTLASQTTKALALFRRFDYYVNGVNPKTALINCV